MNFCYFCTIVTLILTRPFSLNLFLIDSYLGLQAKLNYHQMQQDGLATTSTGSVNGKMVKGVLSSGLTLGLDRNKEAGSNHKCGIDVDVDGSISSLLGEF